MIRCVRQANVTGKFDFVSKTRHQKAAVRIRAIRCCRPFVLPYRLGYGFGVWKLISIVSRNLPTGKSTVS